MICYLKNNLLKKINLIIKNTYLFFILFITIIAFITIIFCLLMVAQNPTIIDESNRMNIFAISNEFGNAIRSIYENGTSKINFFNVIEFSSSRRPVLPYFIIFVYEYISTNYYIIHLFKNLLFGTLIFFTIKYTKKEFNNFFLFFCLILIFYNPHNTFTMLYTEAEEGFLNYLIIILFFFLIGKIKYKSIFVGAILSIIFFTKDSMFVFTGLISFAYIFIEKDKFKFMPIIFILLSNFLWGLIIYNKSGFFVLGASGSPYNALNLANVYQKDFIKTYPQIRPDINYYKTVNLIKEKQINNEKDLNNILIKQSLDFIKDNPKDVFIGIIKKIYVITLSPYKDAQMPNENGNLHNPIRYSNFPNKIFFNVTIIMILLNFFRSGFFWLKNTNDLYYLLIVIFYLAPYLIAFVYPKHCTVIYTISCIYLFLKFIEIKKFKLKKILEI